MTRIAAHCPAGREAVLYRVNDGGHRMPGRSADAKFPRMVDVMLGFQNHDIDGTELIWDFFKRFSVKRLARHAMALRAPTR